MYSGPWSTIRSASAKDPFRSSSDKEIGSLFLKRGFLAFNIGDVLRTPPNGFPEVVKKELGLCGFGGERARSEDEGEETTKFIVLSINSEHYPEFK